MGQEIKCPECGNLIELDWNEEEDECGHNCNGNCECGHCNEEETDDYEEEEEEEDEEDDM